jgi:hypothetical protein
LNHLGISDAKFAMLNDQFAMKTFDKGGENNFYNINQSIVMVTGL